MARPFLRRNRRYGVRKTSRKNTPRAIKRASRSGFKRLVAANRVLSRPPPVRSVPRTLSLFPGTKWVSHRYVDRISIPSAAANVQTTWVFACNNLYDPDVTGTGHQPMFRDECATNYGSYTVVSSSIKITIPVHVDRITPEVYALVVDDASSPEDSRFNSMLETRRAWTVQTLASRHSPLVLRSSWDAAKVLRTTRKAILSDDSFKTSNSSGPNRPWYYHFFIRPWTPTDTDSPLDIVVEMNFVTLWRDRKAAQGS